MKFVDQHVNGFMKIVEKNNNVCTCLYRPFMYIENPSFLAIVPKPQNILSAKQIDSIRNHRRYGNFNMNFKVKPPRRKKRKKFRKPPPIQVHWVPGSGSSSEFDDNLSSE